MTMPALRKILFIDDDPDILTVVKYCFEDVPNITVHFVNSGQEGIREALKEHPDLIILDVMMPEMDGIATLQAIRLIPDLVSIPVIFLTAKAQHSEIQHYLDLGAIDVIIKPFDPIDFPRQIQTCWEKYQERKKGES